jgi:hypothetical protein
MGNPTTACKQSKQPNPTPPRLFPPQVVAEAMMAVLPGIDANDEAKTAAVFQFYTAVLASLPALRGQDPDDDDGLEGAPLFFSEGEGEALGLRLGSRWGTEGSEGAARGGKSARWLRARGERQSPRLPLPVLAAPARPLSALRESRLLAPPSHFHASCLPRRGAQRPEAAPLPGGLAGPGACVCVNLCE